MSIKKTIVIFVAVFLCLSLVSCGGVSASVIDHGQEVVNLADEMLSSNEYLAAMLGNVSMYEGVINKIKKVDYSSPSSVYSLNIPESDILVSLLSASVDANKLPVSLNKKLTDGVAGTIVATISTKQGSIAAVISSVIAPQICFVDKGIKTNQYLLFVFESGYPMLVYLICEEDGAVNAGGRFIINDSFLCTDEESISNSFKEFGLRGITAQKVK